MPLARRARMLQLIIGALIVGCWIVVGADRAATAQSAPRPDPQGLEVDSLGGPAVISAFGADRWAAAKINLTNRAAEPAELLVVTYFENHPDLQYARKVWLPAKARRQSWQLLRTPNDAYRTESWTTITMIQQQDGRRQPVVEAFTGEMAHQSKLRFHRQRIFTGILSSNQARDHNGDEPAYEALLAMRYSNGMGRRLAFFDNSNLPPVAESIDSLDQLVVADNRLAREASALQAVRNWVQRGGRLWVMLDKVDMSTVSLLFGDAVGLQPIDRVSLTEVVLKPADESTEQPLSREFETPVPLVRMLAADVEVAYTVNGWPAAFWKPIGRGEVLFTTLGQHAWMRRRRTSDPRPRSTHDDTKYVATPPLLHLGGRFLEVKERPTLTARDFKPYLAEQIGYKVVNRAFVASVLGAFCLVLAITGLALAFFRRLEYMALAGGVTSLAAAAVLAAAAAEGMHAAPDTVALAQFVETSPGSRHVELTGAVTLYNQQPSRDSLGSRRGGTLAVDLPVVSGEVRRLQWEDDERWKWRNLSIPPGVATASFNTSVHVPEPIEVKATFGPQGLTGTFDSGPLQNLSDAIIATDASQCLAVRLDDDGTFTSGSADVLAQRQYVAGGLINDEQRRRQAICRGLLDVPRNEQYSSSPVLLLWSDPLEAGFDFPRQSERIGSALIAAPLVLEKAPPQTRVLIPSPLLPYRSAARPNGREASSIYGNQRGEWLARPTMSADIWLDFSIPPQVLPLAIDRASFSIHIQAPGRKLELFGLDSNRRPVLIKSMEGPAGVVTVDVDEREILQVGANGALQFGFVVGPDPNPRPAKKNSEPTTRPWRVRSVELEIEGITQ